MKFGSRESIGPMPMQLAPMIDILFLLLIFFVVSMSYARFEQQVDISVPAAETGENPNRSIGEIVVNINKDGVILLEGRAHELPELLQKLQTIVRLYPDQAVILRGDKESSYDSIMQVLDTCKKAGIYNIAFASNRVDRGGTP